MCVCVCVCVCVRVCVCVCAGGRKFIFAGVVLQVGNVRAFERNLLEHESLYVRKKIFVQLTKLRLLLYRNIIKRACILVAAASAGAGRIQMEDMLCVCVAAGWDVDAAELECVVGVLIRRGHIKGQLDKERGAIMLSKRTPFPRAAALS